MDGNIIGHGIIDYAVILFMTGFSIWAGLTKTHRILYIIPAVLTFYFFINFITNITPLKIVPFAFLFTVFITGRKKYLTFSKFIWPWVILVLIVYALLIGFNYVLGFNESLGYSPSKRLVVQIIGYLSLLAVFHILRKECSDELKLKKFLDAFVWTTTILCVYALYQILADRFGLPYRGIVYGEADVRRSFFKVLGEELFRVNSLANEPKRLSYVLFLSVIIILGYMRYYQPSIAKRRQLWLLIGLHLICTFLTYSTSIFFIIGIFVPLILISSLREKLHRYYLRYTLLFLVLFGVVFMMFRTQLMEIYQRRVTEQVAMVSTDFAIRVEPYAFKYISDFPEKLILGIGPGMYNFEINRTYSHLASNIGINTEEGVLQPLNSAWLVALFDFGVLGPILFFLWPLSLLWTSKFEHKYELSKALTLPVLLFLICTAILLNPMAMYFAFMGAFYGVNY